MCMASQDGWGPTSGLANLASFYASSTAKAHLIFIACEKPFTFHTADFSARSAQGLATITKQQHPFAAPEVLVTVDARYILSFRDGRVPVHSSSSQL